jgi:hypothetical protein
MLIAGFLPHADAQQDPFPGAGLQFARGQDVSPTFDGWERNPDGTFTMYFGYYNRNAQEEIDVPIGPDNTFDLGNGDQGQPTHFLTDTNRGRKWWVFKVVVPKDWPLDKKVTWTLRNRGRTNQAKGWLLPEWEVTRAGIVLTGFRDRVPTGEDDELPSVSATGSPAQTITLPAAATLKATATARTKACSKPPCQAPRSETSGLQVRWLHYRGPGKVTFDPATSPSVKGERTESETKVSFSAPGNYRIRAIATDGELFSTYDIDVTVNPGTSAQKSS